MATEMQQALWANQVLRDCLLEADDLDIALSAAEVILHAQPFPQEGDGQWSGVESKEEPESFSAFFAYDIHNRFAQGILNRSMQAAKALGVAAKKELVVALKKDKSQVGEAILQWLDKYRLKLAKLLSATQLASLLEGARDVARDIPPLAVFPGAVPPPPSLEPKKAVQLVDRIEKLKGDARAEAIYELPTDQQTYIQQAISSRDAGGPEVPPPFAPPKLSPDSPEGVHFPTIDEAVKHLSEKNVITRERFDALDAAAKAKSFTVANVDAEETLTKIRDALAENVREGADYETFREKVLQDMDAGTFMSEWHQETVFRTNIQAGFSDGQMSVLSNPLVRSGFPYVAYDSIHDNRVREDHRAMDDKGISGTNIYRINDPVFQTFRPPWDYNCRCGWTAMTVRQAADSGIAEAKEWLDTGVEPTPPAFVAMPDFQPPPGFQRAIASVPMSIRLSMQSIMSFSADEEESEGSGADTDGATDTAKPGKAAKLMKSAKPVTHTPAKTTKSESPKPGSHTTRIERHAAKDRKAKSGKGGRSKRRSLFKGLRVKSKWSPSVPLAIDAHGIAHKGKGRQGGGQFTSRGVEDSDVSGQSTAGPGQGAGGAVQQPDAASAGMEDQAAGPSDGLTGQGGQGGDQSIDKGAAGGAQPAPQPTAVPAAVTEAIGRLDKLGEWANRTGKTYITTWLGDLRKHIEKFGTEESLQQLGGPSAQRQPRETIAYDPGIEYPQNWGESVRTYLNHYGIISYYDTPEAIGTMQKPAGYEDYTMEAETPVAPGSKVISSITKKAREELAPRAEGMGVAFEPSESALTDKLKEAKHLPGLESSEDISVLMGKPITHIDNSVVQKLDEHYGQGGWIIKPYTEDAFAGHGIYFPERVNNIRKDTKQAIYNTEQQLGKIGFTVVRDQNTGMISGLQGPYGDAYPLNTPEYESLAERAKRTSSLTGKMITELPEHAAGENGIPFRDRDGNITDKGFMAQPAFPALKEDVRNRAEGMPYAHTEARVHVTTKGGQANVIPYATFYKKRPFPIVFHDADSKEIERVAHEAVMRVPEDQRQGHVYAPDVIKTGDPKNPYRVVELNPSNEVGSSGHLGSNPLIIDSYVSHLQGREPGFVQFIKRVLTRKDRGNQQAGQTLSVDPRGHAHRGKGSPQGGQFTSKGVGEGDQSSQQQKLRSSRQNTVAAPRGGGQRGSASGSRAVPKNDSRTVQAINPTQPGDIKTEGNITFDQVKQGLMAHGVKPVSEDMYTNDEGHILDAAAKLGILIDKNKFAHLNLSLNVGGAEHYVHEDLDNKIFYKFTRPGKFGLSVDIYKYLTRLEIASKLWPNLGYRFEGILRNPKSGRAQIATSMKRINGTVPDQEEIHEWFEQNGWEPHEGPMTINNKVYYLSWRDPQSGVVVSDTHEGNFIKTSAGLVPIDVDITPKPIIDPNDPSFTEPTDIQNKALALQVLFRLGADSGVTPPGPPSPPAPPPPDLGKQTVTDQELLYGAAWPKDVIDGKTVIWSLPEKILVNRDWDKLRAVVVGRLDNDVLPSWYPSFDTVEAKDAGKTKDKYNSEMFELAVQQTDELCSLLEDEGVEVFRPPLLTPEVAQLLPVGLDAEWAREMFTVIGNRVFANQPRAPHRNKEQLGLEPLYATLDRNPDTATVLRPPSTDWDRRDDNLELDPRAFLEGGDVFRLGKDILITMSYRASSPRAFRWLADLLEKDGIDVWPAYLTRDWEHGNHVFMPIREGLCIAYMKGFVDGLLPSPVTDWDVVALTRHEANKRFAANGLVLGENRIILPAGNPRVVRALEKKGVEVIQLPFDGPMFWQGGVNCATTELWRE